VGKGGKEMNYCNPEGFRNEVRQLVSKGRDTFFSWFDGPRGENETADAAFAKAEDVFTRLMLPSAKKYLKKLSTKTSLDIGYGSGGQVLVASRYFGKSYGLDVHEEKDFVMDELKSRGEDSNIELLIGDGQIIPLPDESIDFIHSWVTFMHLGTAEVTRKYLEEAFRVMNMSGIGVVFFSRMLRSKPHESWNEVLEDIEKEKEGKGFREGGPETRVRGINIQMAMWFMEDLLGEVGFELLDKTASWEVRNRSRLFFGQYGVIFRKPYIKKSKSKSTSSPYSTSMSSRLIRRSGSN
jgi:hypothetical protein